MGPAAPWSRLNRPRFAAPDNPQTIIPSQPCTNTTSDCPSRSTSGPRKCVTGSVSAAPEHPSRECLANIMPRCTPGWIATLSVPACSELRSHLLVCFHSARRNSHLYDRGPVSTCTSRGRPQRESVWGMDRPAGLVWNGRGGYVGCCGGRQPGFLGF
jgi:hypothetical protein